MLLKSFQPQTQSSIQRDAIRISAAAPNFTWSTGYDSASLSWSEIKVLLLGSFSRHEQDTDGQGCVRYCLCKLVILGPAEPET